jgi:acyl-CoA hydrolase
MCVWSAASRRELSCSEGGFRAAGNGKEKLIRCRTVTRAVLKQPNIAADHLQELQHAELSFCGASSVLAFACAIARAHNRAEEHRSKKTVYTYVYTYV